MDSQLLPATGHKRSARRAPGPRASADLCGGHPTTAKGLAAAAPKSTLILARCRSLHPLPSCGGAPLRARSLRSACRRPRASPCGPGFGILRLRRHRSATRTESSHTRVSGGTSRRAPAPRAAGGVAHRAGGSSREARALRPPPRSTGSAASTPPTAAGCRARAEPASPRGRRAPRAAAAPAAAGCARPGARRSAAGPRGRPRAAAPRTRSRCCSASRSRCSPWSTCPRRTGAAPPARQPATG